MTGRLKDYLREGSESSLPDPTAMVALIQEEGLAFYRASDTGKLFVFDRTVPEWIEYTQLSLFSELNDVDWSTPPEEGQLFIWDSVSMKLVPSDFPNSFPEAPEDGTPYSRQDAGWVPSPQGEVEEAPVDGTPYVRQDAAWIPGGGGGGGESGKPWYWNPPEAATFALAASTAPNPSLIDDEDVGLIVDFMTAVAGDEQRSAYVTLPTPTAAWKMTLAMRPQIPGTNYSGCGLIAWDSVGGRNYVWEAKNGADLAVQRFPSFGEFGNTAYAEPALAGTREVYWLQMEFTGTQYIFRWSMNGKQWNTVLTLAVAEYLANPANRVGLTCTYNRTGGVNNIMIVEYFELTGGGL